MSGEITIDHVKLNELLLAKGAAAACPSCSSIAWTTHAGPNVAGGMVPFSDGGKSFYPEGLAVVLLTCKNCGLVRMHDLRMYREAVRGAPDE